MSNGYILCEALHQVKSIHLKQHIIMNAREFFYKVAEMRDTQRRYFETRNRATFRAARALENEIDGEIRRVKKILEREGETTS